MPAARSSQDILRRDILGALRDRLPQGWAVRQVPTQVWGSAAPDIICEIAPPAGEPATLAIETRTTFGPRDVPLAQERLEKFTSLLPNSYGAVGAKYLSSSAQNALFERGLSYIDTTGNIQLTTDTPAIFLSDKGAMRDPARGPGRPRGTLKGAPAARVVRVLLEFTSSKADPMSVSDLLVISGVSTGAVYRVLNFLESENLIERPQRGAVLVPDWVSLLRRWSQDYSFTTATNITTWFDPRGIDNFTRTAATTPNVTYAFTSTLAANPWAAYAPARSAMVYVKDAETAARTWGLRPTQNVANVFLGETTYDAPFDRTFADEDRGGLEIVRQAQAAVDLMTGPGRNPSEAEELITWMENNETQWRD